MFQCIIQKYIEINTKTVLLINFHITTKSGEFKNEMQRDEENNDQIR